MSKLIYPLVVIKLSWKQFAKLIALVNKIIASLVGNSLYPNPTVTLVNFQAALTDVVNAYAICGPNGKGGTPANYKDLMTKARTLHQLVRAEGEYVQSMCEIAAGGDFAAMSAMIATSGYDQKLAATPQGLVGQVRNITCMRLPELNRNQGGWRFKKPLEISSPGNIKNYRVYKNTVNEFVGAQLIGTPSKGKFVDTNSTSAQVTWYYWFSAITAAGEGAISNSVSITLPGSI